MNQVIATIIMAIVSFIILMPMIVTITNSFLSESELSANYGMIFSDAGRGFVGEAVNLKFIPDMVSFEQYKTILLKTPEYLLKFWNSVILVTPIVVFQIVIACLASYGFSQVKGKLAMIIFFGYIILMLMPYQVTLVPNYLVNSWLKLLDTNWAIWLPSIFAPFSVYLITRYMKRIPSTIIEAAKIDGASSWNIFSHVVIPMCKGQIFSCGMLVFFDYWNMVEQPVIMFSDEDKYPLSVFLSRLQTEDVGIAFAAAVIYMIPMILLFLYGEDELVEGVVIQGGIKG